MIFNCEPKAASSAAANIRLLLLDVDGVLTDGRLYYGSSGEELKTFCTLDGHGIKMLKRSGIDVGLISGRNSQPVTIRAQELGIELIYQGVADKLEVLNQLKNEQQIADQHLCFVGDDLPDLPIIEVVGLSFSVPNGHEDIRNAVHGITDATGGAGAVREICDFILKAQDKYTRLVEA